MIRNKHMGEYNAECRDTASTLPTWLRRAEPSPPAPEAVFSAPEPPAATAPAEPESAPPDPAKFTCPRCERHRYRDTPIHDGRSIRRDCAACNRTWGFPVWYGENTLTAWLAIHGAEIAEQIARLPLATSEAAP